jgi:hypothetical protein
MLLVERAPADERRETLGPNGVLLQLYPLGRANRQMGVVFPAAIREMQ